MQSKILFCLLLLGLFLQPIEGSDQDQDDSEESEENVVEPTLPVETTTVGEIYEFMLEENEEKELPPETTTTISQEQIQNISIDTNESESIETTLNSQDKETDDDESEEKPKTPELETPINNENEIDFDLQKEDDSIEEISTTAATTTTVADESDESEEELMIPEPETTTTNEKEVEYEPPAEEEEEDENWGEETSTTEATTVADKVDQSEDSESSEEEETTSPTPSTTTAVSRDEYHVKVRLSDSQESSEEIHSNENSVEEETDSENFLLKKATNPSLKVENVVSEYFDKGLAKLEKSQENLNKTIEIIRSQKENLINYSNRRKGLNHVNRGSFPHEYYFNQRIRETINSFESIIESTERLSSIISKFLEHCRSMNVDQRGKGNNFSKFLSIVEKMQNLGEISSDDEFFRDYFEKNEKFLDDLNVDVGHFIGESI